MPVDAAATEPMTTSAKELLLSALKEDGSSRGLLDDGIARKIRDKFYLQSDDIVEGVVDTVSVLNDDCSRLKLTINVPKLKLSQYLGGPESMFSVWYELDMCKDGKPPEHMDEVGNQKNKDIPSGPVEKALRNYYGD